MRGKRKASLSGRKRNVKGMQGGNGWGREEGERAAAEYHRALAPRMAEVSILVSRSVCVCVKVV